MNYQHQKKSTSTAQLNEEEGGSPQNIRNKSTSEKQNPNKGKPRADQPQSKLEEKNGELPPLTFGL